MTTEIHQTLHGYSDGHRLLAASLTVPSGARRTMLVMSDLSGSGMAAGFETYVTGYPVAELGAYAFARTWYADEMSRPGSVWTHTLLVPFRELGRLPRLSWLQHLFRRPQDREWSTYEKPILNKTVPRPIPHDHQQSTQLRKLLRVSLWALYAEPERPVLYLGEPAGEFESVFLTIWEQQWPRLRRSFTFCTGSLTVRTLGSIPLDLQVLHPGRSGSVRRTAKDATILDPKVLHQPQIPVDDYGWLHTAVEDIEHGQYQSHLRRYLWRYGADVPGQRASFQPLLTVFVRTRKPALDPETLEAATEIVATGFASPKAGGSLKNALIGPPEASNDVPVTDSTEPERLEVLLTTSYHSAFDMHALAPAERAQKVWAENAQDGIDLLLAILDRGNPTGKQVAVELITSAKTADLLTVVQMSRKAAGAVLRAAPTLATEPALWRIPMIQTHAAEALVQSLPPESRVWADVVAAVLDAATDEPAPFIANYLGVRAAEYVLDWIAKLERSGHTEIPAGWDSIVRSDPHAVQEWIARHSHAPLSVRVRALAYLQPSQLDPKLLSGLDWLKIVEYAGSGEYPDSHVGLTVQAFALAVAFQNRIGDSDRLVVLCFQPVHDALSAGKLGNREWKWIQDAAPATSEKWLSGRERASRLRAYLIASFLRYNWDPQQFARAVQRADTLHRMVPLLLVSPSAWKLLVAVGITPESQKGKRDGRS